MAWADEYTLIPKKSACGSWPSQCPSLLGTAEYSWVSWPGLTSSATYWLNCFDEQRPYFSLSSSKHNLHVFDSAVNWCLELRYKSGEKRSWDLVFLVCSQVWIESTLKGGSKVMCSDQTNVSANIIRKCILFLVLINRENEDFIVRIFLHLLHTLLYWIHFDTATCDFL